MIDDVYKTVQTIANKNNYGIITPDRFNELCKDVQLKIVSELPDDMRRAKNRYNTVRSSSKGTVDAINQIQYAQDILTKSAIIRREANIAFPSGYSDYFVLPNDINYLESLWYKNNVLIEQLDKKMAGFIKGSLLVSPTEQYPAYENIENKIYIYPTSIGLSTSSTTPLTDDVKLIYKRLPKDPQWTYITINSIVPIFDITSPNYQDFELPESYFDRIVIEIAGLVGIHLREQEVEQFAQSEKTMDFQRDIMS